MKRPLLIYMLLLCLCTAAHADKVVQASARRMPAWIGGMQEGYIIVSAEAATLEAAQQKAITAIREQIVASVATNVHSATSITLHEVADNGNIRSHREISSQLAVSAADIPYLADVSPSYAEDFYWAKIRRKDKSTYYHYHVKYPLSKSRLRMLVADYEAAQKAINDTLQSLAAVDFADYNDLASMLQWNNRLQQFEATLPESDSRHTICNAVRQNYERMLTGNLHVQFTECSRTLAKVRLIYNTTVLKHSITPKLKSNCLTAIQIEPSDDEYIITYDYRTGCYDDDQNWLEITYNILGKKITGRTYIP